MKHILILLGSLLLIDACVLAVVANFNAGVIFTAVAAIFLISCGVFYKKLVRIKWLALSFVSILILCISLISFIAIYGQNDNAQFDEEAVIVLGAGIRGEIVTLPLAYRLDKAIEYCTLNPQALIVVSGGQGFQESISEALAMERYLISNGISKDKIIKEEMASSTYENLLYSKEILDNYFRRPYKSVLITNNFHIYRATRVSRKVGLNSTHYHAKIQWYTLPVNYLRECVAVIKVWIIGV